LGPTPPKCRGFVEEKRGNGMRLTCLGAASFLFGAFHTLKKLAKYRFKRKNYRPNTMRTDYADWY
jgi:hypothetical protein